jgi:large repetitive protein
VTVGNVITRTWAATDVCGNRNEAIQIITKVDNNAPTFVNSPVNKTIACDQTPVFEVLSAIDNCGAANVTYTDEVNSTICEQIHTRTWIATDAAGNVATAVQVITVKDEVAPTFSFVPADKVLECATNIQFGTPLATDYCSDIIITQHDVIIGNTCGNSGQIVTRTWTVYDVCGNQSQASQSIVIAEDVIAPVFTQQLTATLEMTLRSDLHR